MRSIVTFIQKAATGSAVLVFFGLAMAAYTTMLLYTIPQVTKHTSGMKIFDLSPTGYSFAYATELLQALGESGRDLYLYRQLPVDFIYPGLFAISCCLLLFWLFAKSVNASSSIFYFCLIPVAAGFFDYLENIFIVHMLISYPDVSELHVYVASTMTILKSVFTTAFFVMLLVGVVLFLRHRTAR
ncbi:MAG: hypothetical protein GY763_13460 [Gammaproteobacteria bacterium]|nr:hypothetical protein [Gammaproteobacteria bacterium]